MGMEQYNHDCKVFRGGLALVHDDSVYDRSVDNMPHWWFCRNHTQSRWKAVYGEEYGDWMDVDTPPPPEYYCAIWKPQTGVNDVNRTSPRIHSTWNEPTPTETIRSARSSNKKPKRRYQRIAESWARTRNHHKKGHGETRPTNTTNHTHNEEESPPTHPKPKKRYQVFLERR